MDARSSNNVHRSSSAAAGKMDLNKNQTVGTRCSAVESESNAQLVVAALLLPELLASHATILTLLT